MLCELFEKAKIWKKFGAEIINKDLVEDKVEKLQQETNQFVVFANRYNGIDLPDEACRLLIIDGLPSFNNTEDIGFTYLNPEGESSKKRKVTIIEQGLGRSVRSK